jgi:hypothetical protein
MATGEFQMIRGSIDRQEKKADGGEHKAQGRRAIENRP